MPTDPEPDAAGPIAASVANRPDGVEPDALADVESTARDVRRLSPESAAAVLRVSTRTLERYKHDGLIEYRLDGNRVSYTHEALVRFMQSRRQRASGEWSR
jgi:hypothetical protein